MKDLFVPYEQSLQLKELGFDEPCFGFYTYKSEIRRYTNFDGELNDFQTIKNSKITMGDNWATSPTFSQAFRWFRDKHNLLNIIDCYISTPLEWFIRIDKISNDSLDYKMDITEESEDKVYLTYEEAEIACLDKLIEILKSI